jgi:hypothetical protein
MKPIRLRPLALLALCSLLLFSSCRMLMGDPRKNCNHPQHGNYMREQHQKKTGI